MVLVLISLLSSSAAKATAIKVVVGDEAVPFITPPYMQGTDDVYAPADLVKLFGGTYIPMRDDEVSVVNAAGKSKTFKSTPVGGRSCVSVSDLSKFVGAVYRWDASSNTAFISSRLEMVRLDGNDLTIVTSYPVRFQIGKLDRPDRVYIDLEGTAIGASPVSVDPSSPIVSHIRTGRMPHGVTRVVLDVRSQTHATVISKSFDKNVVIHLENQAVRSAIVFPTPSLGSKHLNVPAPQIVSPPSADQVLSSKTSTLVSSIYAVNVVPGASGSPLTVVVSTRGKSPYRTILLDSPRRIAFDIADAVIDHSVPTTQLIADSTVKSVRVGSVTDANVTYGRVVVDLLKQAAYTVTSSPNSNGDGVDYTITVVGPHPVPLSSTQSLRGKVIVVDPGHGGDDSGALGPGGIREKDITLEIGNKLRDELTKDGADVHMTRDTDVKPSLRQRYLDAIALKADYFVSIHCDDAGGRNSHSGTTVYYHGSNQVSKQLARDVSAAIGSVSGITALGVKSDTIRFVTGFAVLRGSPMPAILVECGYMNSDRDLPKLMDSAVQDRICTGIASGIATNISRNAAAAPLPDTSNTETP